MQNPSSTQIQQLTNLAAQRQTSRDNYCENCIYQASEYLKLRQIGPENQAAHLELKQDVLAVVWSRNTYIHTFYFFTFRITE